MFPPKKPGPGGPPPGGPDPMGGAPPFLQPGSGGPPPMGGMAPPPMLPKPGQGMDPMMAMLHGLGPDPLGMGGPPAPQGPPMGPGGLPVGGSLPGPGDGDGDESMGGSDLLKALTAAVGGGGDPYATNGMPTNLNVGPQDPNMGIEQMLQALALGGMGVGGGPPAMPGGSGLDLPPSLMGQTIGLP